MDEFEKALAEQSEQGSQLWQDIRAGRFTSSEFHRLMKPGYRLMTDDELKNRPKGGKGSKSIWTEDETAMSDDALSYVYEKVAEVLSGQAKPSVFAHATAWGDEWEPEAAEHFTKITGIEWDAISFTPFGDHAGGSADRKIRNKNEGLVIKCPYNQKNHIQNLLTVDQASFKQLNPEYYWQDMANLLWTGWDKIYHVSYDPRMREDRHKMAILEIFPIEKEFDLIAKKLEGAVKEKLATLKSLNQ